MAPHKVIKKRYDKLLDYDNINSRLRGSEPNVVADKQVSSESHEQM